MTSLGLLSAGVGGTIYWYTSTTEPAKEEPFHSLLQTPVRQRPRNGIGHYGEEHPFGLGVGGGLMYLGAFILMGAFGSYWRVRKKRGS